MSISLIFFFAFYAGPFNSVRATLDGWRAEVIAEVEAENAVNYARNQARQQQAEEAERGQHREKQLAGAAGFLKVRAGRPTTYEDVKHYLRRMARSAREGERALH